MGSINGDLFSKIAFCDSFREFHAIFGGRGFFGFLRFSRNKAYWEEILGNYRSVHKLHYVDFGRGSLIYILLSLASSSIFIEVTIYGCNLFFLTPQR